MHRSFDAGLNLTVRPVIATSGPSATYPSLAYRNPLDQLVRFLDSRHGENWYIWEFRAEGTGYPDDQVYNRIWHFPWPDHHPPPFALVPRIMASMRNWLHPEGDEKQPQPEDAKSRVVVVHCKAGKGRSGTMAISYLITHAGWAKKDALQRFTERRMRPNFGSGISIPSQLRWIDYVERWSGVGGRMYVERPVEVAEVHVWGLRDGVKISVEGYVQEGRKIKTFHVFDNAERDDAADASDQRAGFSDIVQELMGRQNLKVSTHSTLSNSPSRSPIEPKSPDETMLKVGSSNSGNATPTSTTSAQTSTNTIFRPSKPIILDSSDINLAVERRATWNAVASVAHVWFNCFFEGDGPEAYARSREAVHKSSPTVGDPPDASVPGSPWASDSGVFTISWDKMDGIKGSSRKGTRAFDQVAVVWRAVGADIAAGADPTAKSQKEAAIEDPEVQLDTARPPRRESVIIPEPRPGEPVASVPAADWRGSVPVIQNEGETGVAEGEAKRGKAPVEGGGGGDGSDSEDGAEGINRGVRT